MNRLSNILIAAAFTSAAIGQNYSAPPVGTLGAVEGQVSINQQPIRNASAYALRDGDVVETGDGRVEVLLSPGVFLRLGRASALEMLQASANDTRLRLHQGSAMVEANEVYRESRLGIETGSGVAEILEAGLYRFDANPATVQVIQGRASVMDERRSIEVHNGERAQLDGSLRTMRAWEVNDELAAWSRSRSQVEAEASVASAQYVNDNPYDNGVVVSSSWVWNPWRSSYTWIPARQTYVNFYGFRYWAPSHVYRAYPTRSYSAWRPAPVIECRPVYRERTVVNRTYVYNRPQAAPPVANYTTHARPESHRAPESHATPRTEHRDFRRGR